RPPRYTLFPYTTLFRSRSAGRASIQKAVPNEGSYVTFTAGLLYRPSGKKLDHIRIGGAADEWGVSPDKALAIPLTDIEHEKLTRSEEHTSELQSQSNLV